MLNWDYMNNWYVLKGNNAGAVMKIACRVVGIYTKGLKRSSYTEFHNAYWQT